MTAFTDVANPRRLIKALRLTLCTWDTVRSEPSGRRTSPVDLSLVGMDALERATEGALSVRLRLVVEPVDLEAARFEHGFQESAPIADTVKGPGPFAAIALWIDRKVGDALFGESGEEKAPIRCEEAAKISQIDADGLGLHVREHRVQVDNLERAVVKRMPEIAREGRAAGVVAWVPDVQADELVGRVGPFDVLVTPLNVTGVHIDAAVGFDGA